MIHDSTRHTRKAEWWLVVITRDPSSTCVVGCDITAEHQTSISHTKSLILPPLLYLRSHFHLNIHLFCEKKDTNHHLLQSTLSLRFAFISSLSSISGISSIFPAQINNVNVFIKINHVDYGLKLAFGSTN